MKYILCISIIFCSFSTAYAEKNCILLTKHQKGKLEKDPLKLKPVLDSVLKGFRNDSPLTIQPLLHSKLYRSISRIRSQFTRMKVRVGAKPDYTYMRVYAINTDGEATPVDCEEGEIQVFPVFGFDPQVVLWLQVSGQREVAHVILNLTKEKDKWVIARWHDYLWTNGENTEKYFENYKKHITAKKPDRLLAFMNLSMAHQLARASRFIQGLSLIHI